MIDKSVVVLGAGISQVPLIEKASNLGLKTVAIDKNPSAPGFNIADYKINISTHDAAKIETQLELIKDNFEISGIINGSSGVPVVTKAKLSKRLNLRTYSSRIAEIIIHKSKMIPYCHANNISVPETKLYRNKVIDFSDFSYPLVIKPSLSAVGKSGVYLINNSEELLNKLDEAMTFSLDGSVNIEEYIKVGERKVE